MPLRKTAEKIHGAGDAIRGSINIMADRATGDHAAGNKNEAVLDRGLSRMNAGNEPGHHGTGATSGTTTTTGTHAHPHGAGHTHGVGHTQPEDRTLLEQGEQAHHGYSSSTTTGRPGHDGMAENPHSANHGPHSSNLVNKADPRVDSDRDGRGGGVGHNTSGGPYSGTAGSAPYSGTTGGVGSENLHSTNHGPHSSNITNKADPRIDSDRDGRGGVGHNTSGGPYAGTAGGAPYSGTAGGAAGENLHSTNHGPHSSNIANKADPRVDSDRDGHGGPGYNTTHTGGPGYNTAHTGGPGHGTAHTGVPSYNTTHTGGPGYGAAHTGPQGYDTAHTGGPGHSTAHTGGGHAAENLHSTNHGPHSSNMANKADPRIDSDLDSGRHGSAHHAGRIGAPGAHDTTTTTGGGYAGENPRSSNHGPHSSNLMNKLDPNVDSDRDNGRHGSAHHAGRIGAPGTHDPASTASTGGYPGENLHSSNHGPHSSNLTNKADPRIDSDRDGRGVPHGQPRAGQPGVTDSMVSGNHGPHSSNLGNKLDPSVDSDMDGRAAPGGGYAAQGGQGGQGGSAFARNLQS